MKKKKRIVTIILWLAALAVLFIWSSPEQKVEPLRGEKCGNFGSSAL